MLTETYDIKDLYIVKFKEKYLDKLYMSDDFINYFKPNLKYIVERFSFAENELFTYEVYKECIVGQDFYSRENKADVLSVPKIFASIEEFPDDLLDEEEREQGLISSPRLFQIFQEINYRKVKKIGRKK